MKEVAEMLMSDKYSSVKMGEGGGYLAIEKSPFKHKPEELAAAKILSDKGYKVILTNEAGKGMKVKSPDGFLFVNSFEQRTPTKDGANTIRNALFHARDKQADIALVYSKEHVFSRKSVEEGIKLFEEATNFRFKQIIVVADNGHIHRHRHTDK